MPSLATRGAGTIKGFGFAGAGVPGSPTGVYTNGTEYQKATINFSAPASNGGLAITGYRVTSSGGQVVNGTSSPIIVTGLTNGTSYTFTVQAINSAGPSVASSSTSVTPNIPNVNVILSRSTGDYTYVPPYTMNVAIMAIGGGGGGGAGGYTGTARGGQGGGSVYINSLAVTGSSSYAYMFYNPWGYAGSQGGNAWTSGSIQAGNAIYFKNNDGSYIFQASGGDNGSSYIWPGYTGVTRNGGAGGDNSNPGGGGGAAGTTGNGGNGGQWTNTSSPPYQATVAQAGSGNGGGGGGVGTGYGTYGGAGGGGFKAAGGTASHGSSDAANIHLGGAAGSGGFPVIQGGQGGGGSGYNGSGYTGGNGGNIGGGGGGSAGYGGNGGPGVLVILEGVGRSIEPYA